MQLSKYYHHWAEVDLRRNHDTLFRDGGIFNRVVFTSAKDEVCNQGCLMGPTRQYCLIFGRQMDRWFFAMHHALEDWGGCALKIRHPSMVALFTETANLEANV